MGKIKKAGRSDRLWWKHGVLYQIYPRSFRDTNGDGIGDIPGIIEKLDYLKDLGIDGVWISPINVSPMFDFGYDISDYRKIDQVFGTDGDFARLIKEAHARGIRIIMDLVLNHTSHLHPWFEDSRSGKSSPKRDWYIWHDGKKGKVPNNWMGAFGGSAWEWDGKTGQYYMHSFLKEQPDVNWRNKKLREAVYDIVRFWLDKGVDGFRLDVVNQFVKDDQLRRNPFALGQHPRPYDMQKHIYDRDRPELHDYLKEFRKILDSYSERMSVGEVNAEAPGNPKLAARYLGRGEDQLHLVFDFSLISRKWSAVYYYKCIEKWDSLIPGKGWPCYVLSNHDQPRAFSRFSAGKYTVKRARVAAALLLTLRGTPFIYYGEEIGMRDGKLRRGEIIDPVGVKYWPFHKGRDPERTPMQWNREAHAGFSTGKPWLPVNNDYQQVNVFSQKNDPNSLLNFYGELISLRLEKKALHRGSWKAAIPGRKNVLAYYRGYENEKLFIALNFSRFCRGMDLKEEGLWKVVFSTHKVKGDFYEGLKFDLAPYEVSILEKWG